MALVDSTGTIRASLSAPVPLSIARDEALGIARGLLGGLVPDGSPMPTRVVAALPTAVQFGEQRVPIEGAARMPSWAMPDTREALAEAFSLPAYSDNDAALAALAEMQIGQLQGAPSGFYFMISATGIGRALTLGHSVLRGADGFVGELSHFSVRPNGVMCPCGQRGCLGAEVRNIARELRSLQGIPTTYADEAIGVVDELNARAPNRAVIEVASHVARAIGSIINVWNPARVCVTEPITDGSREQLFPRILEEITDIVHPGIHKNLAIVTSGLGSSAPLHGAGLREPPLVR